MDRDDILRRYREARTITGKQLSGAMRMATPALLEHARHLGLAVARTMVFDSEEEMSLVADLAVYSARPGRSRAIDRFARAAALPAGSTEALLLEAVRQARFSIWCIERPHDLAGLIVTDLLRQTETWLMDENLALTAPPGDVFASRLCWPAEFAMTCGVFVPVSAVLLADLLGGDPPWLRKTELDALCADPRFATAVYRAAIENGVMESVAFEKPMALAS